MAAGVQLPGSGETIDLQQQVARLQALLEASRQVHSTVREEEVLEQVLRIVVRELEMAGAAFTGTGLEYGDVPVAIVDAQVPGGTKETADEGQIDDAKANGSGAGPESQVLSMAASARLKPHPVREPSYVLEDRAGRRMAELRVATPGGRALTLYEADFIEGLVLQAAVALENARNHKRNIEFARVQQDLDAAREIQRSLLPHELPEIPGYSLAFRSDTCYEVGGDYLDIVDQPDGIVLMAVADVAGKGLASAIMSTSFRSAFRAMAAGGPPLDELATRMNQHHWAEGEEARRRYVTAIFLKLDPERGEIEVVNAGHNPGFLIEPGAEPVQFDAAGTPLGLLPGMRYRSERHRFLPGTRLLFYTDGLTEVFKGDEEFGPERLLDEFLRCPAEKADAILDALWGAIEEFSEGGPQGDDMTALALCRGTAVTERPA